MESKWKEVSLGDILDVVTKGTTPPKGKGFVGEGINFIKSESISYDGRIDESKFAYIDADTHTKFKRSQIQEEDILFSMAGAFLGKNAVVNKKFLPANTNQALAILRINKRQALPKFISFCLRHPKMISYVNSMSAQSAQPNINFQEIKSLPIKLPPIEVQKRIASILGSLDDKIELNRQMNQTLEQMAQTLFKSWFVDFDPVIDNALAAGNPIPEELQAKAEKRKALGMEKKDLTEDIQKLFPDEFEYSEELEKWVPSGWKLEQLSTFINVKHGYAFKGKFFSAEPTDNILLTPGNFKIGGGFKGDKYKFYNGEIPNDYILRKDDLIITMTDLSKAGDTLGYPAFVPEIQNLVFLHNQRLGKVEFKNTKLNKSFLYYSLCTTRYRYEILGSASGTTVKHTAPVKILAHKILFSNETLINYFEKQCVDLFKKMQQNDLNILQLTKLRDTLLPKLISGQVRVHEVEKITKQ